jgi:hypothetical protein
MARITLDQIRAVGDVTSTFRWNFVIVSPPTSVGSFPTTANADLRIETAGLPKKTGTTVDVVLKGHKVRYPGIYQPAGNLPFTFVETVDNTIAAWFAAWQQACWNDNTGVRVPKSELEATIQIIRLDNADSGIWQYTMKGCFLEDSDPGRVDNATQDPLKPSLTLSYDDFTQGPL